MKLRFGSDGLLPMVIQDADTGAVLSLFYANKRAVELMKKSGYVWRYSRSKKKLMKKGKSSGNMQKIISMAADCDSDALLVRVVPEGPACHKGTASCFDGKSGVLSELTDIIAQRRRTPGASYTSKIVGNRKMIISKLREECEELIGAKKKGEIIWEAADLLYFSLVYLENRNVVFSEVLKELRRRRNQKK